jgi:hypothetical protein
MTIINKKITQFFPLAVLAFATGCIEIHLPSPTVDINSDIYLSAEVDAEGAVTISYEGHHTEMTINSGPIEVTVSLLPLP